MSAVAVAAGPIELARELAAGLITEHAADVDRSARFPAESIAALHDAGLLAAAAPAELGGAALTTSELAAVGRALARGCASTAMIWAMHQVQLACLVRHASDEPAVRDLVHDLVVSGGLIASMTSEKGIGGDLRSSIAACVASDDRVSLSKRSPTISYGEHAAAFLITARRTDDAPASDQVAVLALLEQTTLTRTSAWDTMGMRGTCSPGFDLETDVPGAQVLATPFAEIAGATMVPLSHILWSGVWLGLADEALARAARVSRAKRTPGQLDADPRLAQAGQPITLVDALLSAAISAYDAPDPIAVPERALVQLNDLKVSASILCAESAQISLSICGMGGYSERSPVSVARILRDLFSARLMIANERLDAASSVARLMLRGG